MGIFARRDETSPFSKDGWIEIVFTGEQFNRLHTHLFRPDANEQGAYAFAAPARSKDGRMRLLVHHLVFLNEAHFSRQTPTYIELTPETQQVIANMALESEWSLIEIHSHPFADDIVHFSQIDDGAAKLRFRWFAEKMQAKGRENFYHAMLVLGVSSADAYIYDPQRDKFANLHQVTILSTPLRRIMIERAFSKKSRKTKKYLNLEPKYTERFNRQIMAFGEVGQQAMATTRVGIVGLGGMGSDIACQLARLGVREFVLVDNDTIEASNLNRFVGGRHDDVGKTKVDVVAREIWEIDPAAQVTTLQSIFPTEETVDALKTVDFLWGCVDNDGARLLLNQFAQQYLLPYLDLGVGLMTDTDGKITEAGGQYRLAIPGEFCLECIHAINATLAAQDLLTPEQREIHKERGYIPSEDIHAPAVGFLNGILATLGVGEFLNYFTGYRPPSHLMYYFLQDQTTRNIKAARRRDCAACHPEVSKQAHGDLERVTGLPMDTAAVMDKMKDIPLPNAPVPPSPEPVPSEAVPPAPATET